MTKRSYQAKKGAYGVEIRYYPVPSVTQSGMWLWHGPCQSVRCKVDFILKTSIIILKKKKKKKKYPFVFVSLFYFIYLFLFLLLLFLFIFFFWRCYLLLLLLISFCPIRGLSSRELIFFYASTIPTFSSCKPTSSFIPCTPLAVVFLIVNFFKLKIVYIQMLISSFDNSVTISCPRRWHPSIIRLRLLLPIQG